MENKIVVRVIWHTADGYRNIANATGQRTPTILDDRFYYDELGIPVCHISMPVVLQRIDLCKIIDDNGENIVIEFYAPRTTSERIEGDWADVSAAYCESMGWSAVRAPVWKER